MATPTPRLIGPACAACGEGAVVNWQRSEVAGVMAVEQERRALLLLLLLADPQLPPHEFGPLPTSEGMPLTVANRRPPGVPSSS